MLSHSYANARYSFYDGHCPLGAKRTSKSENQVPRDGKPLTLFSTPQLARHVPPIDVMYLDTCFFGLGHVAPSPSGSRRVRVDGPRPRCGDLECRDGVEGQAAL